jgi:hypothetical protein
VGDTHPLTASPVGTEAVESADGLGGIGQAFRLADAQTGVCIFGATGSGKTSGPAKHLAYGYLAADFGGLVLCAKKDERRQWQQWAADTGRAGAPDYRVAATDTCPCSAATTAARF